MMDLNLKNNLLVTCIQRGGKILIPGGQDGQLQYDGFWIYSVKDGEMETVKDVLEGEA